MANVQIIFVLRVILTKWLLIWSLSATQANAQPTIEMERMPIPTFLRDIIVAGLSEVNFAKPEDRGFYGFVIDSSMQYIYYHKGNYLYKRKLSNGKIEAKTLLKVPYISNASEIDIKPEWFGLPQIYLHYQHNRLWVLTIEKYNDLRSQLTKEMDTGEFGQYFSTRKGIYQFDDNLNLLTKRGYFDYGVNPYNYLYVSQDGHTWISNSSGFTVFNSQVTRPHTYLKVKTEKDSIYYEINTQLFSYNGNIKYSEEYTSKNIFILKDSNNNVLFRNENINLKSKFNYIVFDKIILIYQGGWGNRQVDIYQHFTSQHLARFKFDLLHKFEPDNLKDYNLGTMYDILSELRIINEHTIMFTDNKRIYLFKF